MQKWEYKSIKLTRDIGTLGGVKEWSPAFNLNDLGKEGWELVAVVPAASETGETRAGVTTAVTYFFKRPIE